MKFHRLIALVLVVAAAACSEDVSGAGDGAAADATGNRPGVDAAVVDGQGDALAVDCMPSTHPGTVTFVDEDTGITTVDKADTVPDSIKWKETPQGRVPVVKVVKHKTTSGMTELSLYGPCGQLLEVVHATT
jgi:hypothetical protein